MLNLLLIAALLSNQEISLQVVGSITGTIVEARTGAPLAAVLVKVQSTGQQAFSDGDGAFRDRRRSRRIANAARLRRRIRTGAARCHGRCGRMPSTSRFPSRKAPAPTSKMSRCRAVHFARAEPGVASQSTLGSRELLALRGLVADDPFRAVQVLPGVATGDDFRAEFAVRGLGPSNIGISIDGVDSPLLFHTVRGVQDTGSLGLINSDILESATLLAGPHPQRLNSHLGSRLDFTTRDGSRERLTVRGIAQRVGGEHGLGRAARIEQEGQLAGGRAQELHRLAAAADRLDHRHHVRLHRWPGQADLRSVAAAVAARVDDRRPLGAA